MNQRTPTKHDQVILKFMEKTIENINTLLAGQHAMYKILIEKGIVTESELISKLRDSKNLPDRKRGVEALEEMLRPNWEDQINFQDTEEKLLNRALEKITQISTLKPGNKIPPNSTSIRNAVRVCQTIFSIKNMLPDLISSSNDDVIPDICLKYIYDKRILYVSTYNDGKISALVVINASKGKHYNEDIQDFNFDNCLTILTTKE